MLLVIKCLASRETPVTSRFHSMVLQDDRNGVLVKSTAANLVWQVTIGNAIIKVFRKGGSDAVPSRSVKPRFG